MQQQVQREAHAYLELTVRTHHGSHYVADLRFYPPDSDIESDLVTNVPVALDPQALLALTSNPSAYSHQITTAVFSDARMREAWAKMLGYIQGANATLHLRIRLDISAEALHHLRWELLCDPTSDLPLCRRERFLFSRYLDTADLTRVQRPLRHTMHALIAIANPRDLLDYKLVPIDTAGELTRIRSALQHISATVLATQPQGSAVTLTNLFAELRKGYSIVYLLCHGTMHQGNPYLWLERDDGTCHYVAGTEFIQRIADLPAAQRPVLIVLASCQSAGTGDTHEFLASLGPQLARAGVLAVIGMQGNIPTYAIERMMPLFFQTLLADGQVDYALAVARAQLSNDDNWWAPVLFTRARDGRIWTDKSDVSQVRHLVHPTLSELADLLGVSAVREVLNTFLTDFRDTSAQIQIFDVYKRLHDQLHDLQFECFNCLSNDILHHYPDPHSRTHLDRQIFVLQRINENLHDIVDRARVAGITREQIWIRQLDRAWEELCRAAETLDSDLLDRSVRLIGRILETQPIRINQRLKDAAESLRLARLIEMVAQVQAILSRHGNTSRLQQLFHEGVTTLHSLHQTIEVLVREHDAWQDLDRNLRLIQVYLDLDDVMEFTRFWQELRVQTIPLYVGREERWAQIFTEQDQRMESAMQSGNPEQIRSSFMGYQRQSSLRLFRVDKQLIDVCHELQLVGEPLDTVLGMLV